MSSSQQKYRRISCIIAAILSLGSTILAYAITLGRNRFRVVEENLYLLPKGSQPLRILHLSDVHMTPGRKRLQEFMRTLTALQPDLVINTGDNLSHEKAVPSVLSSLGGLLDLPGCFVMGSNDYYAPDLKNPLSYFFGDSELRDRPKLPWASMRAVFVERGWHDAVHHRCGLTINGTNITVSGVDDPHIRRDNYDLIAGPPLAGSHLAIGLTHSPEPHILDRFAADGYHLILAGHTHGGQVCLPNGRALVTNCGIDPVRAHGCHKWKNTWLNVTAGLGTSRYAPFRYFCPPEVSLITVHPIDATTPTH